MMESLMLSVSKKSEGERLNVVGDIVTIKATGEATGGAFSLLEVETPPGGGAPMHVHSREDEAFYVLEGAYELLMEGKRVALSPGSFAFVPRGTTATYRNAGNSWGRLLILCTPAGHEVFMRAIGRPLGPQEVPQAGGPPTLEQAAFLIDTAAKFGVTILPPSA